MSSEDAISFAYGLICDAAEREWHIERCEDCSVGEDDGFLHTSSFARAVATRAMSNLWREGFAIVERGPNYKETLAAISEPWD